MNEFQRKIKSLTHNKYLPIKLDNLPNRLSNEELEKLVIKLKELKYKQRYPEFIEIRNEIVKSHMKLAVSIASRFGSLAKNHVDDLVGESFYILIKYTKMAAEKLTDNNITPYLISGLHGDLNKLITEGSIVYMPERTVRYYGEKGRYFSLSKMPFRITLLSNDPKKEEESENFKGSYIIPETSDIKIRIESEVMEVLDKVTTNFIEKRVIQLRSEEYTYKEIGPLVGLSTSAVALVVQDVERRFDKEYKKI